MAGRVLFSNRFPEDLAEAEDYYAMEGEELRERFVAAVKKLVVLVAENPERYGKRITLNTGKCRCIHFPMLLHIAA